MKESQTIPAEIIERRIYLLRGQKVMLSIDLASLYGVEHKVLMQAVHRNTDRFPEDFLFQLSQEEFSILKPQFVTSRRACAKACRAREKDRKAGGRDSRYFRSHTPANAAARKTEAQDRLSNRRTKGAIQRQEKTGHGTMTSQCNTGYSIHDN